MTLCPESACCSARHGTDVAVPPMSGGYVEQIWSMFILSTCMCIFNNICRVVVLSVIVRRLGVLQRLLLFLAPCLEVEKFYTQTFWLYSQGTNKLSTVPCHILKIAQQF